MPKPMSPDDEYATAFNDGPDAAQAEEGPQEDVGGIDPTEAIEESAEASAEGAGDMLPADPDAGAAEAPAESTPTEAIEEVVEAVESGEMTVAQAMQALSDDFGEEFPRLLHVLIKAATAEAVKPVANTVNDVIADIVDSRQRAHFEAIADAHPDFMDVASSPAMQEHLASLPDDQRAQAQDTIERGNAKKIIALLSAVKAMGKGGSGDAAMDAAEGVRSGGLRIPEQPKAAQDYEAAWEQF